MNSTMPPLVARRDLLGIEIAFSYERTGVGRNLNFAGYIYFDGSVVESRAYVGKSPKAAENFLRTWCESLTEADVVRIANEEVEAEREVIAKKQAELDARKGRAEALARKLIGEASKGSAPCPGRATWFTDLTGAAKV